MSSTPQDDRSIRFIQNLMKVDSELIAKFEEIQDKPEKIPEAFVILRQRIDLFRAAERQPRLNPYYRLFISSMQSAAIHYASLFWTKTQFDEQISQIVTRLDDLENEVKRLKEKLDNSS
jgi:uncharacterized protein YceH (UPF0502 family)